MIDKTVRSRLGQY